MAGFEERQGGGASLTVEFSNLTPGMRENVLDAVRGLTESGITAHIIDPEGVESAHQLSGRLYSVHATVAGERVSIVQYGHIVTYDTAIPLQVRTNTGHSLLQACYDRRDPAYRGSAKIPAVTLEDLAEPVELMIKTGNFAGIEVPVFMNVVNRMEKHELKVRNIGTRAMGYLTSYREALRQEYEAASQA